MKISIVMPCFNCVDYIERAIRSVVEQDYEDIELYIKDGGSKDGTVEIIKDYKKKYPKIIKWESSKDQGQTNAINIGIKKATGDILSFLNGDDVYKKGALKEVARYFLNNPSIMWVYGRGDIIDEDDRKIRQWITSYKNFWMNSCSYFVLLILNYIPQMSCFWRREAFLAVGNFDEKQFYAMDYDYWLRLGSKYKAGFIDKYLASFRIVKSAKSSTGFTQQFSDEYEISKKYTYNKIIIGLHFLHIKIITLIYSIIKFLT